jgi:DNA-3-methyladenine glycosylase II
MKPSDYKQMVKKAAAHLVTHDAVLAPVIMQQGLCTIQPHKNYYQDLVESIIGQQLSVKAAASIRNRFKELFGGHLPSPEEILTKTEDELRSVGFSGAKARYVRDLAQHVIDGKVEFKHLPDLSDDAIIAELTDVKGIGEWTVHMFLMFAMGRPDVLAYGDLGIRNGIKELYSLDRAPSPQEVKDIAKQNNWHPYASVACWYIWAFLDNKPANASSRPTTAA